MRYYYYLHENGDMISKPASVVDYDPQYFDSPFVKKVWGIDTTDRRDAWTVVLERLSLGANITRIKELADKWELTEEDMTEFLVRVTPSPILKTGLEMFSEKILNKPFDQILNELKERNPHVTAID